MRYRCKECDVEMVLRPGFVRCSDCAAPIPVPLRIPSPHDAPRTRANSAHPSTVPVVKAQRKYRTNLSRVPSLGSSRRATSRISASKPPRGVLYRNGESWYMRWAAGGPNMRIRLEGDVPAELLADTPLAWHLDNSHGRPPIVRPLQCKELDRIRKKIVPASAELARSKLSLGPDSPGTSALEIISDPMRQLRRINELSNSKDDPEAWAALANGYRIHRLRRPIEAAIRSVGVEKVRLVVLEHPGIWPDGLHEFLDNEMIKRTAVTNDGSLASAAARRGDYGAAD